MNDLLKIILPIAFMLSIYPNAPIYAQASIQSNPQIEKLANSLIEVSSIPGISIAASKNGALIYSQGFGYADVEYKIKMAPNNTIRTASVAKVITATALGKLASDGKLNFDDSIDQYISYVPKVFKNITIRELAGHTAGVAHRGLKSAQKRKQYTSIKEVIELFNKPKLKFDPNESYEYSTAGYNLLAAVIEGASGMGYMQYMNEKIFEPLGMTNTYAENIKSPKPNEASIYFFRNHNLLLDNKLVNGSYKLAGAGYRSTPTDLVKMTSAYHNGMIDKQVVNEMLTSNQLNNGSSTNVGISWRNNRDIQNKITVDHAGGWQGARTVIVYYPVEKLSVAIMINARCNIAIEETAHIIAQFFLADHSINQSTTPIDQPISVEINTSEFEQCTGRVKINEHGTGSLQLSSSKESLQSLPIFKLPCPGQYAIVTSFGILYMQWNSITKKGSIYVYQSLRQEKQQTEKPFISFETQQ